MTTKSKKSETVDARPGEVVVRAHPRGGFQVAFLPTGAGSLAYVLPPDTNCIVPARLLADRRNAGDEIEVTDSTRGVLPSVTDLSDTRTRAILRDGREPEPGREERVVAWKAVVVSEQLARPIVETLDAIGFPSFPPSEVMQDERAAEIVRDIVNVYERSFENGTATREPWVARSQEIVAIHRAREAGLVEEPAPQEEAPSVDVDALIEQDVVPQVEVES